MGSLGFLSALFRPSPSKTPISEQREQASYSAPKVTASPYSLIVAAPRTRRNGPFTAIVVGAACVVVVSICTRTGKHPVNSTEESAQANANRQPLTLEQISQLDQKPFERSLPQLCQVIVQTTPAAKVDQEALTTVQGKLRQADESRPDYWPAVLRFLPFASSRIALKAPPAGGQAKLLSEILQVGVMRGIREYDKAILFDAGSFGNSGFTNCRIVFTQNSVEMQNVVFKVCAFDFPVGTPSAFLKKLCRTLLASDLASVSIPSLRGDSP